MSFQSHTELHSLHNTVVITVWHQVQSDIQYAKVCSVLLKDTMA